jgi:hypothetical protein
MKLILTKSLSLLIVALAIILPYSIKTENVLAAPNCAGRDMTLDEYNWFKSHGQTSVTLTVNDEAGKAVAHLVNNTDCKMPVGLYTFQMYDNNLSNQTKFDSSSTVVPAHTNTPVKLKALIPECMVQIDTFLGATWQSNPSNLTAWLIANQVSGTGLHDVSGNYCSRVEPLIVSCSANPSTTNENGNIKWVTDVTGGNGSYTYSWSGTDGLTGNTKNVNKVYQFSGTKNATVTVVSGNKTKTANCSATVSQAPIPLSVSCSANPSSVNQNGTITWTASAIGGNGSYTYSWSGTDGLSGNSQTASKPYSYSGTKNALVTVTSGGVTRTANCSATVTENITSLVVSCSPSSSSVRRNSGVYWNASASGGSGAYSYYWSGTDGLSGSGSSVYSNYSIIGSKTATITVNSNGQSVSASCSLNVFDDYFPPTYPTYLEGSCSASPYNAQVGSNVYWSASAYGGSSGYSYHWTGTDNLYGYGSNANMVYYTPGYKTATVTISSGGQSITRTCSTNVGQVLAYTQTNNLPTLTSVYLSDIPYTGLEDKLQVLAFVSGLIGFSALIAYFFAKRKIEESLIEQIVVTSIPGIASDVMKDKFVCDRIVTDKQAFENVEDIAMNNKTVLSSDAVGTIVKNSRINCTDEKDMAIKVINACRKDKNQADGEWCVIGEEDVRKII